jgi:hypothetical protein
MPHCKTTNREMLFWHEAERPALLTSQELDRVSQDP